MKHGTGMGTGTRMGYGAGVEYIATGVGVYIGTGHGSSILFGSQFSSADMKTNTFHVGSENMLQNTLHNSLALNHKQLL